MYQELGDTILVKVPRRILRHPKTMICAVPLTCAGHEDDTRCDTTK
jgi:hypothetical protein